MATSERDAGEGLVVLDALAAELEQIYSLAHNAAYRRYTETKKRIALAAALILVASALLLIVLAQ